MKKTLSLLTLGLISQLSLSQVTFENGYTTNGNNNFPKTYAFFTDSGLNYYTMDSDLNQVYFYNSSHNLFLTTTVNPGTNFKIKYLYLVTDKLFYTDSKIEFIAVSENEITYESKMTLYNEDGTNLFEFGDRWEAYCFKSSPTEFKIIVATDKATPNLYDVYSVTGTLSQNQQEMYSKNQFLAFPNPTSDRISFTTDIENGNTTNIEIFDNSGKKVISKLVRANNNRIDIDVSELSQGIYFYKINGKSNKFIKK